MAAGRGGRGWLGVLPVLKHAVPLPRLTKLMWRDGTPSPRDPREEERVLKVVGGLSRRAGGNCLARSLVVYRCLSRINADPVLVAGMSRKGTLVGHAWVTVDGRPLLESPESLDGFVEVLHFGPGGIRLEPQV